jgi:hypothetical protein
MFGAIQSLAGVVKPSPELAPFIAWYLTGQGKDKASCFWSHRKKENLKFVDFLKNIEIHRLFYYVVK